jgi:hypothetical protein
MPFKYQLTWIQQAILWVRNAIMDVLGNRWWVECMPIRGHASTIENQKSPDSMKESGLVSTIACCCQPLTFGKQHHIPSCGDEYRQVEVACRDADRTASESLSNLPRNRSSQLRRVGAA